MPTKIFFPKTRETQEESLTSESSVKMILPGTEEEEPLTCEMSATMIFVEPPQLFAEDHLLGVDIIKEGEEVICSFLHTNGSFLPPILGEGEETKFTVTKGTLNGEDLCGCQVVLNEGPDYIDLFIRRGSENLVELQGI